MTKSQIQKRILQNGKPLEIDKFEWDETTRTFSSNENRLVLDFKDMFGCTFNTGSGCTFTTGSGCTFTTGSGCTFNTGFGCTFNTGSGCTFVVNNYSFPVPPLRFNGSRYFMEASGPDLIRSGCIEKPAKWWADNVRRCAEEHNYTPEQIDEYELYVRLLIQWFDNYGNRIKKLDAAEKETEND